MAKNDVQDFIELRLGFQGMADFSAAALRFLDKQGIALRAKLPAYSNGYSNGTSGVTTLREKVKRHYKKRRQHHPHPGGYSAKVLAKRRISLALLDALDPTEPRRLNHMPGTRAMGSLVRRGYARKVGNGYVRTSKPYLLNKGKGSNGANDDESTTSLSSDVFSVAQAAKRLKVSETHVRSLVKQKKLAARREQVEKRGRKPQNMLVLDADEVARYAASTR